VHPPVSDMQLTVATESQLEDEGLLQLVKDLAREDFALCGEGASFTRRIRYDRMMRVSFVFTCHCHFLSIFEHIRG